METKQLIAMDDELGVSMHFIKRGIESMESEDRNDYVLIESLCLLSLGLERLCKIIVILDHFSKTNEFISSKRIKKEYGHSLTNLKEYIYNNVVCESGIPRDVHFFQNNSLLSKIILILDNYAMPSGRYVNFSYIADEEVGKNPVAAYRRLESHILEMDEDLYKLFTHNPSEYLNVAMLVQKKISNCIRRYVQVLARQLIIGKLSGHGKRFTAYFTDYLSNIDD